MYVSWISSVCSHDPFSNLLHHDLSSKRLTSTDCLNYFPCPPASRWANRMRVYQQETGVREKSEVDISILASSLYAFSLHDILHSVCPFNWKGLYQMALSTQLLILGSQDLPSSSLSGLGWQHSRLLLAQVLHYILWLSYTLPKICIFLFKILFRLPNLSIPSVSCLDSDTLC